MKFQGNRFNRLDIIREQTNTLLGNFKFTPKIFAKARTNFIYIYPYALFTFLCVS